MEMLKNILLNNFDAFHYSYHLFTIVIVIKSIKLFQRIMLFFKIMYICKYVYFVYWCWVMQPRYDVKMYLDSHKPINAEWPSLNSNKTIKNYNPHIILTKGVKFFESDHWSRRSLLMGTHAMWTQSSQLQQLIVSSWHSSSHTTHGHCKTLDILNRLNEKNIPSFIRLLAVTYMTGVENILTKGVKFGTWSNCDQTYRNWSVYYLCINDTLTYPNFLPQSYMWQLEVL
jgi:hypothetical protein